MKVIKKAIDKTESGYVTLCAEEDEDMWHVYNLINAGDEVRAPAIRRVVSESSTGSTESHRVRLNLTLQVERVAFDASNSAGPSDPGLGGGTPGTGGGGAGGPGASGTSTPGGGGSTPSAASGGGATLSISGRVTSENPYVKMGAYHTLDLEKNRNFTIGKEEWDSVHLERIQESADVGARAEVGAVVMGEGTAAVCLLTEHMTVVRQRIDMPIPRKRKGSTTLAEKATSRFYAALYAAIIRLLSLPAIRLIILASPGFTKDTVYEYLFAEATRRGDRLLLGSGVRQKFLRLHCSSPHVHSLVEVLSSPEVASQLKDTRFAREGLMLDKFFKMLSQDELRAWYGEQHVERAAERGAVGTLLISDGLFRSPDPQRRKRFVRLVEECRKQGAEVLIFSSMHESGMQLNQLTGIAAILTFPLDIEVVEEEERVEREEREERERREREAANGGS